MTARHVRWALAAVVAAVFGALGIVVAAAVAPGITEAQP